MISDRYMSLLKVGKRKQTEKMKRDQLNDEYLNLIEKQRLYFKTVKDFQEVIMSLQSNVTCSHNLYDVYGI